MAPIFTYLTEGKKKKNDPVQNQAQSQRCKQEPRRREQSGFSGRVPVDLGGCIDTSLLPATQQGRLSWDRLHKTKFKLQELAAPIGRHWL